ncbi:single-stranded DNA-binding protein [Reichenbachiella sp.]|uniref:single-stranded DNA-binding protein n=1 Tax=Reichenbachiella sp. TaxID=2184521 RepID=UPI0032655701
MLLQNNCQFIGNLGNDPEVKHLDNEKTVVNFNIAVNESYKNKQGEKVTTVDWMRIVLWNGVASIAEKHLKKGSKIAVAGKARNRSYQDKEGVTKYITEYICDTILMLDGKNTTAETANIPVTTSEPAPSIEETELSPEEIDDLQF